MNNFTSKADASGLNSMREEAKRSICNSIDNMNLEQFNYNMQEDMFLPNKVNVKIELTLSFATEVEELN